MNIIDLLYTIKEVYWVAIFTFVLTTSGNVFTNFMGKHFESKKQMTNLKIALRTELEILYKIYEPRKVPPSLPKDGNEIHVASLNSEYTTVYKENCSKIGMLDKDTAESVVKAYTHLAALMDTLRVYSKRWEDMVLNIRHGSKEWQPIYRKDVDNLHDIAYKEQEDALKAIHDAIEKLSK